MNNSQKAKLRKEMEYEDAPSGAVTLYNYKEPFMPFDSGFGFQGVLLFDAVEDKCQCHFCGEWFEYLTHHIRKEHGMKASEYKDAVGLAQTTALIGEKARALLIKSGLDIRLRNLVNHKGKKRSEETRRKISETLKQRRSEYQNITGTCPAQLIERLQKKYQELGDTPTEAHMNKETFERVFGSWKNACEAAGIPYYPPSFSRKPREPRYSRVEMVAWIKSEIEAGRIPLRANYAKDLGISRSSVYWYTSRHGGWMAMCIDAMPGVETQKTPQSYRYTEQELIDFLVNFKKINGRNPSNSDCRRGLLPTTKRYIYRFGSFKKALAKAGLITSIKG